MVAETEYEARQPSREPTQSRGWTSPGASGQQAVANLNPRLRSSQKLGMGAVLAMIGFLISFVIAAVRYVNEPRINIYGKEFESGNGYWPSTVSEAIHASSSAEGKIFFAFCFTAALMVWTSEYPYMLANVFTGPDTVAGLSCCGNPVYWSTFRQFVPQLGLLLLICVPTVPAPKAVQPYDGFAQMVHLLGATLMFVGYLLSEFKCLGSGAFKANGWVTFAPGERKVRIVLAVATLVSFLSFLVFTGLEYSQPYLGICCPDKFVRRGEMGPDHKMSERSHLINTASHTMFKIKVAEYVAEVLTGTFALASHLCIAIYAKELQFYYGHLELGIDRDTLECTQSLHPRSAA
jgi:hypothetical protein